MKTIITSNTFAASIFALIAVFATIYANDFTATVLFTGIACGLFVSSFIAVLFILAEHRADIMQRIPATIKRDTASAARIIKRSARIAWTAVLLLAVLAVSFATFYLLLSGTAELLDLAGIHGAARVILTVVLMFTVVLDLTLWVELNAMALATHLGLITDYQGSKIAFRVRPFSVIGLCVRDCRA